MREGLRLVRIFSQRKERATEIAESVMMSDCLLPGFRRLGLSPDEIFQERENSKPIMNTNFRI